jgi:hypothetical protein
MRISDLIVVGIRVSRGLSIGDALGDTTVSWDGLGSFVNTAGQIMYPDLKLFSDAESSIAETLNRLRAMSLVEYLSTGALRTGVQRADECVQQCILLISCADYGPRCRNRRLPEMPLISSVAVHNCRSNRLRISASNQRRLSVSQ